jgi:hypothetical protein
MSETKFTPSPWLVTRYTNYEGFSIWAEGVGCIAERWWPTEEKTVPIGANAQLIAASPDMHAALDRCMRWINPNVTEKLDQFAEAFYRETGTMAPGKSMPLEMAMSQPPDDVRASLWKAWCERTVRSDFEAAQAALGKADSEIPL